MFQSQGTSVAHQYILSHTKAMLARIYMFTIILYSIADHHIKIYGSKDNGKDRLNESDFYIDRRQL